MIGWREQGGCIQSGYNFLAPNESLERSEKENGMPKSAMYFRVMFVGISSLDNNRRNEDS